MAVFPATPAASQTSSNETKANVTVMQYGDGYSSRIPQGLNNLNCSLSLVWRSLTYTERDTLVQFLEARNGVESFDYTIPAEATSKRYFCRTWKVTHTESVLVDVTATFEQVFDI